MPTPQVLPVDLLARASLVADFKQYLAQQKNFSAATIESYHYNLSRFSQWLTDLSLCIEEISYSHLLLYIKNRRAKGDQKRYINDALVAIRHYFDYLIGKHLLLHNPASNLYIRGVRPSIPHHLLDQQQLNSLYDCYQVIDPRTHRNKVMLGLLIYQGLSSLEVAFLKPAHIDLQARQVKIVASRRSNSRNLLLEKRQMLLLKEYLHQIRPQLLDRLHLGEEDVDGQLFFGMGGAKALPNTLLALMREVRKDNHLLRNAPHIRMSVITEWLKTKDVRVVQYLAGHKYVSSTERYQVSHLSALQAELTQFHPLQAGWQSAGK